MDIYAFRKSNPRLRNKIDAFLLDAQSLKSNGLVVLSV